MSVSPEATAPTCPSLVATLPVGASSPVAEKAENAVVAARAAVDAASSPDAGEHEHDAQRSGPKTMYGRCAMRQGAHQTSSARGSVNVSKSLVLRAFVRILVRSR